jgi:preprotein translocase subunit YajC
MLFILAMLADGEAAPAPSLLASPLLPFLVIVILFFWMMSRSRRQEQNQRQLLLANLKKNDKVLTSGGIVGIIALVNEKEDEVILKVDESSNVRLRVLKSSIIKNYTSEDAARDQAAKDKAAKDEKAGKNTSEAITAAKK